MKEQIITEIAEILQSYSEERLKLIVRLVTVLATATDRTAGLSEKAVLRHCKTRKIEKSREVIPCSLFLFGFSSTNFSPVFYEPCFKFWAINIRTTTCSEKLIALIFAFSASARIVGE